MEKFSIFSTPTVSGGIKLPVCLVLDTSGSMIEKSSRSRGSFTKIDELNRNMDELLLTIQKDSSAKLMSDICLIACGGEHPTVLNGYTSVDKIRFDHLEPSGRTPLGESVNLALDLLEKRRDYYRKNNIEHYKPIMMIMTDGLPTEEDSYVLASAKRCCDAVEKDGLKLLPICIGEDSETDVLDLFSPKVKAKKIVDINVFMELFKQLSKSMSQADNTVFDWLNDKV